MKTNLCGTHFLLIWLIAALFISGCGPVISQEVRKEADQTIGFEELLANPDAYRGRTVLLGGVIAGSVNKKDGTLLERVTCKRI